MMLLTEASMLQSILPRTADTAIPFLSLSISH